MPRRIKNPHAPLRRTFIREWREFRNLSQDRLVDRVRERVPTFSKASLSRIENGKQPYSQPILEALADALSIEPQDLLMRHPESFLWSIVDNLQKLPPDQQKHVAAIVETFRKAS